jgi:hypothetical protein
MLVRRTLTFYRWIHTEPGSGTATEPGIDHGQAQLTLVVEVHRNPRSEGWLMVGALGPQVAIPENPHLRVEGRSAEWHLPTDGHNDPRQEILGAEVRTDEPIRAYLAAQPDAAQTVVPGAVPAFVRLPGQGVLPPVPRSTVGQYDAFLVVVIPVQNRRGGRYLLQVLDMNAEPGGFSQNGVMAHAPTRAEVERFTRWMRDPRGMALDRRPPIAIAPIDRS